VIPLKPAKETEADQKAITGLCHKQVNYWHSEKILTSTQIESIQKIAKTTILYRCRRAMDFVNALHKGSSIVRLTTGNSFDPDMLYLTAQTMFRSRPDSATLRERDKVPTAIFNMGVILQRRLFYAGLFAGHIPSALCLWWSLRYDLPEGKFERDMILRCLDEDKALLLGKKISTLVKALKADAAGDISAARGHFDALDDLNIMEFQSVWKLRVEYLFAINEEKALANIISGQRWLPATDVVQMLSKLSEYTKDEGMRTRLGIYRLSYFPTQEEFRKVAERYDGLGQKMMAREYYEIAGMAGDRESQEWMVQYLLTMGRKTWLKRPAYAKALETWKGMLTKSPEKEE
jgi:hypothetical protein